MDKPSNTNGKNDPCKGCSIKESCENRDRASQCPCIKCLVQTSCTEDCNDFDLFFVGRRTSIRRIDNESM